MTGGPLTPRGSRRPDQPAPRPVRLPQAVQQRIVVLAYTRPAVELIAGLRIADSERVVPPQALGERTGAGPSPHATHESEPARAPGLRAGLLRRLKVLS